MVSHGRVVFGYALVVLAYLTSPAAARDPDWYEDIQYLTWDVRADEAEAARAASVHGEVFLQPSQEESETGWYASCGQEESRVATIGALPRQIVGAFSQLVGKSFSKGRSILMREGDGQSEPAEVAPTYTALRPVSNSRKLIR